jgi:hypothetical protein
MVQMYKQRSVLNRRDIQKLLRISEHETENIMNSKSLPIIIIGTTERVLEEDLYHWLQKRN